MLPLCGWKILQLDGCFDVVDMLELRARQVLGYSGSRILSVLYALWSRQILRLLRGRLGGHVHTMQRGEVFHRSWSKFSR